MLAWPGVVDGLYLTVPMKRTGSWGMTDSLLRRSSRPMELVSTPSMVMVPAAGSTSLNRATPRDDFPVWTVDTRYTQVQ